MNAQPGLTEVEIRDIGRTCYCASTNPDYSRAWANGVDLFMAKLIHAIEEKRLPPSKDPNYRKVNRKSEQYIAERRRADRLRDTMLMIADSTFNTEDAERGLLWCQGLARAVLKQ